MYIHLLIIGMVLGSLLLIAAIFSLIIFDVPSMLLLTAGKYGGFLAIASFILILIWAVFDFNRYQKSEQECDSK